MGTLIYGAHQKLEFDDRLLAHLQIVISTKLRRREGFYLSWRESHDSGSGRVSIWLDASIPLMFRYTKSAMVTINREWLEELTLSSNTASGLLITGEAHLSSEPVD
jgi:hypothetical protein